jgi:hypothetical protein
MLILVAAKIAREDDTYGSSYHLAGVELVIQSS